MFYQWLSYRELGEGNGLSHLIDDEAPAAAMELLANLVEKSEMCKKIARVAQILADMALQMHQRIFCAQDLFPEKRCAAKETQQITIFNVERIHLSFKKKKQQH